MRRTRPLRATAHPDEVLESPVLRLRGLSQTLDDGLLMSMGRLEDDLLLLTGQPEEVWLVLVLG